LQVRTQAPAALQVTAPFVGAVHTVQLFPHDVMSVLPLITHLEAAPVPHRWYPLVQSTPHSSGAPEQVAVPLAGMGQGVHAAVVAMVPHDIGLLLSKHELPQRW
jgi:hypothetical protein